MKLHNVRLGFANNSSSTHSLVFFPNAEDSDDAMTGDFGWQHFTLASKESKQLYLAHALHHSLVRQVGETIATEIALAWTGHNPKDPNQPIEGYGIDHQSLWDLPRSWDGKAVDKAFFLELRDYLLKDGVVVLGGNDNGDSGHPLSGGEDKDLPIPRDYGSNLVARKDGDVWVLFDRGSGSKVRLSFDRKTPDYEKASAPELVDIKITDYCDAGCSYCYMGSTKKGEHADSLYSIISALMEMKVFEVAIGGGEPTLHPKFVDILRDFRYHGITPNFTTKSLAWIEDEKKFAAVLKEIGSFAYSAETAEEVERLHETLEAKDFFNSRLSRMDGYANVSVQVVLGVVPVEEIVRIAKACQDHHISLTLLGFKHTGRGEKFKPLPYDTWMTALQKAKIYRVAIDTLVAKEFDKKLKKAGVSPVLYHKEEGKFSMYIDAVAKKMGPSSYCNPLMMRPLTGFKLTEDILKAYRNW